MPSPQEAVRLSASRSQESGPHAADPGSRPVDQARVRASLRPGFTLIEVMVVTAVVGIIIGMAATRINTAQLRVDGAVQQLASTFMMAQRTALNKQHNVVIALDTANGYVRVHLDSDNDGVLDAGENINTLKLESGVAFGRGSVSGMWFGNQSASFVKKQGGSPALTFNRNGSASERGGFYVSSSRAIHSAGFEKEARAVMVERASGRVSRFRYNGVTWQRS
jgi:prepilin-type N-terminal cleavage/methylation domain-containing protein